MSEVVQAHCTGDSGSVSTNQQNLSDEQLQHLALQTTAGYKPAQRINKTMKTTTIKNNGIIITSKVSKFTLLTRPEIAPKGQNHGVITEVVNVAGTENGQEFNRMDIVIQLDAKNSKGQPFTLTKSYNLAENGRGLAQFVKDYNSMTNGNISKTDLYDLNPESLQGLRIVADVDYSKPGKEVTSVIKDFLPAATQGNAAAVAA